MGVFGPLLQWSEPWSWKRAGEELAELRKAFPPLWRMLLYCVVLPVAFLGAVRLLFPDIDAPVFSDRRIFCSVPGACVFLFILMPHLIAICPLGVTISRRGVVFSQGNTYVVIEPQRITGFYFETRDGKRFFTVDAVTKRGQPFQRRIMLPEKRVTEQGIIRFFYDLELAHLYRGASNE